MSELSPRAMTGQPSRCGAVGASKTARNQAAVTGWKQANGSCGAPGAGLGSEVGRRRDMASLKNTALGGEEEAKAFGPLLSKWNLGKSLVCADNAGRSRILAARGS